LAGEKIVSDGSEAIVGIPVIAPVVEVELAIITVQVQVRHIAIAIEVAPKKCA
jgi:hypothetical protein